jgi:hypothetical protein
MSIDHTIDLDAAAPAVDPGIPDQQSLEILVASLETKVMELEALNHKLRVQNVGLRSSRDALKSRRSFENRIVACLGMSAWLLFISFLLYNSFIRASFGN